MIKGVDSLDTNFILEHWWITSVYLYSFEITTLKAWLMIWVVVMSRIRKHNKKHKSKLNPGVRCCPIAILPNPFKSSSRWFLKVESEYNNLTHKYVLVWWGIN